MKSVLRKADAFLHNFEKGVVIFSVWACALLLIANVIGRSLLKVSVASTEEVSGMLIVIMTFIGTAYAVRIGRHIRMSAVYELLPQKFQKILIIITHFLSCIGYLLLAWFSYGYLLKVKEIGVVTPVLRISRYYIIFFTFLGFLLAAVEAFKCLAINFADPKNIYTETERTSADEVSL